MMDDLLDEISWTKNYETYEKVEEWQEKIGQNF